jgi:hypothetical protein
VRYIFESPPSPTIYASTHLLTKSPVAMIDVECDAKMQIRLEVANLQAELDWLRQQLASSPEDLPKRQSVEAKPKIVSQEDKRLCPRREVKLKRGGTTGHFTLPPSSTAQIDSLLGRPSLPSAFPKVKRDVHQQHLQQPLEASTKAQPHQEKWIFQQTAKPSGSSYAAHALLHQIGSSSRALSKTPTRNRTSLFSAIRQRLYDLRRTKLTLQDDKIVPRSKTTTAKDRNQGHATMARVSKAACYHSRSSPQSRIEEVRKVNGATRNELSNRHASPSVYPCSNYESVGVRRSDTGIQNQVANPSSSFPTKTGPLKTGSPLDGPPTSSCPTKTGPFKTGSPLDIPLKCAHSQIRVDMPKEGKRQEHSAPCRAPDVRDTALGMPSLTWQNEDHAYLQSATPRKKGGTPVQYLQSLPPQDLEFKTENHANLQSKTKLSRTPECKPWTLRTEPQEIKKSSPRAIDHGGKTIKQRMLLATDKHEEAVTRSIDRPSGPESRITSKGLERPSLPTCQDIFKGKTSIQTIISKWDAAKPFPAGPDVDQERGKVVRAAEKPCEELHRRTVASVETVQDVTSPSQPMPIRLRDAQEVQQKEIRNKRKEALPSSQATSKQSSRILAENGFKASNGLRSKGPILNQIRNAKHVNPLTAKPEGRGVVAKPKVRVQGHVLGPADFLAGIKVGIKLKQVEDNLESRGTCSESPPTLLDEIKARIPLAAKPECKGVVAKPKVPVQGHDLVPTDFLAGIKAGVKLKQVEDNLESRGTCSESPPALLDQIQARIPLSPKPEGKGVVVAKPKVRVQGHDLGPADFLAGIKAGVKLKYVEDNLESRGTCSESTPTLLDQIQARKKELRQLKDLE